MNEADTRAELIEPQLAKSGWSAQKGGKIFREYPISRGRVGILNDKKMIADYILSYKNVNLAVLEAKALHIDVSEGIEQAKLYAQKLSIRYALAANGEKIYFIDMQTGKEGLLSAFPSPQELYDNIFSQEDEWRDKFNSIPFETIGGSKKPHYYQEIAVNKAMEAIAQNKNRILLTLATGTGKTFIAFQISWKLFKSRWTINRDSKREPRILFLADRNILADQAFNSFSPFPDGSLIRIRPDAIKKKGEVPTNGSVFFTIFQTFMSGQDGGYYFGQYSKDFFDFIVIDECHRGGSNDESKWRAILEHFSDAFQLGLTATPKRQGNADTYRYFGKPVYVYSLKDGINDGFLTPFKVRLIQTTMDEYVHEADDIVVEGEVEKGRIYKERDFNKIIEIEAREKKRVELFMDEIDQMQKTIVFCANQAHAAKIRDLINQRKNVEGSNYCVRVTANDGPIGEGYLREFQDNDKTLPVILTTSQKLSTGVDARNVRNIVLLRPVNSMIEFKQIIGRGTRLFDNKNYFTLYDFVGASKKFFDKEWDGEAEIILCSKCAKMPCVCIKRPKVCSDCRQNPCACLKDPTLPPILPTPPPTRPQKIIIQLADGKERRIFSIASTLFIDKNGNFVSAEQFVKNLYGDILILCENEDRLRAIWRDPQERKNFLAALSQEGYDAEKLKEIQILIDAKDSDIFDVLAYIAFAIDPITREKRAQKAQEGIVNSYDDRLREFLDFVLSHYADIGVEELESDKLPHLMELKYKTIEEAIERLGCSEEQIRKTFLSFQGYLY